MVSSVKLRVLELFCGIGGCAAALGEAAEVVAAIDIDRDALAVYARNFPAHPTVACTLESLPASRLAAFAAELWWLSPPCQPFTRRGLGRDDADPRAAPLLALVERLAAVRPRYVALENVPAFAASRCRQRLLEVLAGGGYRVRERCLCPSELGMPNRRRRYYLVASCDDLAPPTSPAPRGRPLAACLEADPVPGLAVAPGLLRRYAGALDLVDAADPLATTACFTAAYGRSPVRSGSYLRAVGGVRRFSPREILRLLGFPAGYTLPADLPLHRAWSLVGNSLSLPAVRTALGAVPELAALGPHPDPLPGGEGASPHPAASLAREGASCRPGA